MRNTCKLRMSEEKSEILYSVRSKKDEQHTMYECYVHSILYLHFKNNFD